MFTHLEWNDKTKLQVFSKTVAETLRERTLTVADRLPESEHHSFKQTLRERTSKVTDRLSEREHRERPSSKLEKLSKIITGRAQLI